MPITKTLTTFSAAAVLALGVAGPAAAASHRHDDSSAVAAARWRAECGHLGDSCAGIARSSHHKRARHAAKHHVKRHAHKRSHTHKARKSSHRSPMAHRALGYTGA